MSTMGGQQMHVTCLFLVRTWVLTSFQRCQVAYLAPSITSSMAAMGVSSPTQLGWFGHPSLWSPSPLGRFCGIWTWCWERLCSLAPNRSCWFIAHLTSSLGNSFGEGYPSRSPCVSISCPFAMNLALRELSPAQLLLFEDSPPPDLFVSVF